MAGDWIKMRADLLTHPKVVRIVSALKADKLRVIGGLHAVWCLFDMHSSDGMLEGYNAEILDAHLGWPGFSVEMARIGWLETISPNEDQPHGLLHLTAIAGWQDCERDPTYVWPSAHPDFMGLVYG